MKNLLVVLLSILSLSAMAQDDDVVKVTARGDKVDSMAYEIRLNVVIKEGWHIQSAYSMYEKTGIELSCFPGNEKFFIMEQGEDKFSSHMKTCYKKSALFIIRVPLYKLNGRRHIYGRITCYPCADDERNGCSATEEKSFTLKIKATARK